MLSPSHGSLEPLLRLLRPHLPRVTLVLLGALCLLGLLLWWQSGRERRLQQARQQRGEAGERDAEALLARAGYTIVATQHEGRFPIEVDGQPRTFRLRADFLVRRRDGRLLIAEVKTGAVAPQLQHGPTRRQLLEYALAYRPHVVGVLLVLPEQGEVLRVHFPVLRLLRRPLLHPGWWFLLGAGAAAAAQWYLLPRL